FGLQLPLVRRPATNLWEGRFLVPEGFADGRYPVRILVRDASGAAVTETKHFILDGTPPRVRPEAPAAVRAGETLTVSARTPRDGILLSARLGARPPGP